MNTKESPAAIIITLVVLIVLFSFSITKCTGYVSSAEHVTFTVNDKERLVYDDTSKWIVMGETPDGTYVEYELVDSIWYWQFGASKRYNMLKKGETYEVKVTGYRNEVLSWYPNLVEIIKEVELEEPTEEE